MQKLEFSGPRGRCHVVFQYRGLGISADMAKDTRRERDQEMSNKSRVLTPERLVVLLFVLNLFLSLFYTLKLCTFRLGELLRRSISSRRRPRQSSARCVQLFSNDDFSRHAHNCSAVSG